MAAATTTTPSPNTTSPTDIPQPAFEKSQGLPPSSASGSAVNPSTLELDNYATLSIFLRMKIQDYEIALLKAQLAEQEKEMHILIAQCESVNPSGLLFSRLQSQERQIRCLKAEIGFWKETAAATRNMLGRAYHDLTGAWESSRRRSAGDVPWPAEGAASEMSM